MESKNFRGIDGIIGNPRGSRRGEIFCPQNVKIPEEKIPLDSKNNSLENNYFNELDYLSSQNFQKNENVQPEDAEKMETLEETFRRSNLGTFEPSKNLRIERYHRQKKFFLNFSLIKKIISWILLGILLIAISLGSFFFFKFYSVSKKINISVNSEDEQSIFKTLKSFASKGGIKLKNANEDRVNILLLGIAGKGKAGQNLTDTIMIASLNLKTNQVALLSIPRDLYVEIPEIKIQSKINSVYQIGLNNSQNDNAKAVETISKTIEEIISQKINYYVILNFEGFEKIIDSVGGINITSERDIYDASYPGPNYSYETFELKKGFHQMDGATALKYARERHDDPEGDFGRAKRQQQVIQSAKNKIFSAQTFFNVFSINSLLNALGDNIVTNIASDEIGTFFELARKLDMRNINNVVVDAWNKESLLKVSHVFFGETRAFILVPRVGNWSEIRELSENIFDLNKIKRRKEEIAKEDAFVGIINKSGEFPVGEKIKKLLSVNLGYKNVVLISDSGKTNEEKTSAYDLSGGVKPFSLDEIITKLTASLEKEAPVYAQKLNSQDDFDILVVIGKDIASKYNIEEDSIDDLNKSRDEQEYLQLNSKE